MPRKRTRLIAEHCRQIMVSQMPAPGERTCLRWADDASATLERQGEAARIGYRWHDGERWHVTMQTVQLVADTPYLGGFRCYLACPNCGRQVRKLYDATGGSFACRHCGQLANACQREGAGVRSLRRARKVRGYLGAEGGAGDPLPTKPKGMRTQTYAALCAEVRALESVPPEAWLSDGHRIVLGIRRCPMTASRRRWWPGRNGRSGSDRRAGHGG